MVDSDDGRRWTPWRTRLRPPPKPRGARRRRRRGWARGWRRWRGRARGRPTSSAASATWSPRATRARGAPLAAPRMCGLLHARSPPRRAAHVWAYTRAEPPSPRRAHPRPPAPHRNGRVAAAPSRYASGRQSGPVGMAGRGGDSRRRAWGRRREARGEGRGRARETGRRHAVTRSWGGLEGRRRNPSAWEPRLDAAERGRGAWKEA